VRLESDGGLWSTGPLAEAAPVVAVLEVSGAVLSWVVDDDPAAPPSITFTEPGHADWLWRVLGESGHVAVLDALGHREPGRPLDLPEVEVLQGATDTLRRLAIGHWLRRWWPASDRDGIAALDRPVLDAEVALLTVAVEDFFTDDTLDSDVAGLLAPHMAALNSSAVSGDPRVVELVEECRELACEIGLDWPDTAAEAPRREDYALAAGAGGGSAGTGLIAGGVATVDWSAVPPGVFDAAEDTIGWSVTAAAGAGVDALVEVALSGRDSPSGIAAEIRGSGCRASGFLDAAGRAVLEMRDPDGRLLTETQAWNLDWSAVTVRVGAEGIAEPATTRDRVRTFARARLSDPRTDAYLAEVLAAESDY
jgi:hypothetical protein